MKALFLAAALAGGCAVAHAGDLYGAVGFPVAVVGYSQPLGDRFGLRVDAATVGSHHRTKDDPGIHYDGRLKANRLALLADWYVSGGLRLTGGVTATDARATLYGVGTGGTITLGDTAYVTGPDDRFEVVARFPRTMPYLGLGYGMVPQADRGWGWNVDLGFAFGKPKITGRVLGSTLPAVVTQQDIDLELADLRRDADRIKGLPQLTVGASYRF